MSPEPSSRPPNVPLDLAVADVHDSVGVRGDVGLVRDEHDRVAGLVQARSEGKQTYYALNQERIAVCCGQLMQVFAPESEVTEAVKSVCEC